MHRNKSVIVRFTEQEFTQIKTFCDTQNIEPRAFIWKTMKDLMEGLDWTEVFRNAEELRRNSTLEDQMSRVQWGRRSSKQVDEGL